MTRVRPLPGWTRCVFITGVVLILVLTMRSVSPGAVTLRFLQTEPSPETIEALKNVIGAFQARNPGVSVEMETVGWAAQMERLIAGVASGQPPDVTMLE